MKKAFKKTVPFLMAILFLSSLAYSQIREAGIIQGNVTDAEGNSLPGVTVSVESPGLIGGVHTRLTDAGGFFKFPFMTVGVYKVTAELAGFSKSLSEGIKVNAGKTLTVDFKLTQATLTSEVMVQAKAPTIDVKSSQAGTVTFSTELIQTLPGKPTFDGLFNMAPGTDYYTSYGSGYASPNSYQMDGVSVVDPMWGGISFTVDTNVIAEATFQGLGMPAEFGEASGAVLTTVTKSGSNKLSGLVDFRYNGDGWNSQNLGSFKESDFLYPSAKYNKVKVGNYKEISAQVGGKIIRDKLWFFLSGGYNYNDNKKLGLSYVTKVYTPTTFAKLTYQLNKANKFNVSFKYANDRTDNMIFNDDIGYNNVFPGIYAAASWTSIFSPTTYLDVKAGFNHQKTDQLPTKGLEIPGGIDLLTGNYVGNVFSYQKATGRTFHLSAHLSHYIPYFLTGSHDITAGAEIQRDYTLTISGYPGGEGYFSFGSTPFWKFSMAAPLNQNAYFGPIIGFVQDTWTLTKRLTLNIGFRYDNIYFNIPLLDPQSQVRPSTIYKNDVLAPRLGLTYDLFGDRKNIIKLYYGKLVEKTNRNMFSAVDTRSAGFTRYEWQDGAWVKILEWLPGEPPSPIAIDPNIKHPYINELSAAYERELFKDASLSVNVYYKTLGKALGQINTTAQWETVTIINPGPDGIVGTSDDLGPLDVYRQTTPLADDQFMITNPVAGQSGSVLETPWKKMRGIEFIFSKRYSKRWQMLASYHYTKCTGNVDSVEVYLADPNRYVNNRGEMVYYYGQPHQFKLQGSVLLPLNIMLGVTAQYISGHPVQAGFYTVENLASTQINGYVWGDKKWGPLKEVSVKFEKRFPIKGVELTGYVDFYNVFNFHCTPYTWNRVSSFGPNFGKIQSVQAPRSFRVGARLYF
jgi:hypothetical protein